MRLMGLRKRHEMPARHKLEQFLDEYLAAAGIRENRKTPSSVLTDKLMNRVDAYRMVRRRTADAGLRVKLGCHMRSGCDGARMPACPARRWLRLHPHWNARKRCRRAKLFSGGAGHARR